MKYNTAQAYDRMKFLARAQALADKGACVDLSEMTSRSLSQNAYLHLLIGIVAMEGGVSLEYAKTEYFKRLANRTLFVRTRHDKFKGEDVEALRSTASLSKEEMTEAIDKFKTWASMQGIILPNSQDRELAKQIEVEISRYKRQYEIY